MLQLRWDPSIFYHVRTDYAVSARVRHATEIGSFSNPLQGSHFYHGIVKHSRVWIIIKHIFKCNAKTIGKTTKSLFTLQSGRFPLNTAIIDHLVSRTIFYIEINDSNSFSPQIVIYQRFNICRSTHSEQIWPFDLSDSNLTAVNSNFNSPLSNTVFLQSFICQVQLQ